MHFYSESVYRYIYICFYIYIYIAHLCGLDYLLISKIKLHLNAF